MSGSDFSQAASNVREYTVSELSYALKRTVEETYDYVRVRGEITGFKRATSGHLYLALKDADSVIDAVCWKGTALRLPLAPQDGLEVIATGKLTTYPGRSKYQLVIQSMEPAGVGALMALLEERKKALAAEGLFDPARKRPIPYLPRVIGIVTSPTGAVIRDILHRLADRFPRDVLVWPVLVQGEGAAEQVARAIRGFNAMVPGQAIPRPDLLIVARGGGSLEDLWAFNEEIVVRAAAESDIPLISAVGHETDTTLIDFASDLRAPTPTAAAEKAVPVKVDLMATVADLGRRLEHARSRGLAERSERLRGLARGLPQPQALLALPRQRLDDCGDRLPRGLETAIERKAAWVTSLSMALTPHILRERVTTSQRFVQDLKARGSRALRSSMDNRQSTVQNLGRHLRTDLIARDIARDGTQLDALGERLGRAGDLCLRTAEQNLTSQARLLDSLGYRQVLSRGFSLVRGPSGQPVTSITDIRPGADLDIEFMDGHVAVRAVGSGSGPAPVPPQPKQRKSGAKPDTKQGTLL